MIKNNLLALAAISALSAISTVQANDLVDNRWYAAPFGTFVQPGGDRDAHSGWGGGLGLGKMIDEHFNVELRGFYQDLEGAKGNGDWDLTGGTADVQYYLFRDKFSPYAVIGAGGMNSSHNFGGGASVIGEAGAGFTYELHDNFLVRSDVRYRYTNNLNAHLQPGTEEFHDMTVNLGFVVPFGAKPAKLVATVPAPAPLPVAVKPVAADCSTLDDDKDGVNNCSDKCPNTMAGVEVNPFGCWVLDIKFDNDKDVIKSQYYNKLDKVAERIRQYPDHTFEIQGHTSHTGTYKHNINLSERRALAVKKYLSKGSNLNNITSHGYGWDQPIDSNDTEAGRANNRRVQIEVDSKAEPTRKR